VAEGSRGLAGACQIAGAECVLAPLWPAPDTETGALMSDCLRRWLDGAPPATALRQAQLALIRQLRDSKDEKLRHAPPLYSAGFASPCRPHPRPSPRRPPDPATPPHNPSRP